MSDNTATQVEPFLTVNGQFIKDLSFENPEGINSFFPYETEPEVHASVNLHVKPLPGKSYEVELLIRVEVKNQKTPIYVLDLNYAGVFTIGEVEKEALKPLLLIECPRLLFPFARSVISHVTSDSGFPPFLLQPFDFAELYKTQGIDMDIDFTNTPEGNV